MAVDAGRSLKHTSSLGYLALLLRRFTLLLRPAIEGIPGVHVHAEQHLRVLRAAVLGALARNSTTTIRIGITVHASST
jgi:hypothetical protein